MSARLWTRSVFAVLRGIRWRKLLDPAAVRMAWRIESEAARWILRRGKPDVILHFLGGLGDELLLTCVARELRRRNPSVRIWQIGHAAELLQSNPDYALVLDSSHWALRHSNLLVRWRLVLRYSEMPGPGREIPPREHILAVLCRKAGITGSVELRPWYHFRPSERTSGQVAPRQIAIQSVGRNTHETWMANKCWYHERFQTVVDAIRDRWPGVVVVQVGVADDPPLRGVYDLRGKTTLRQTAAILANSLCFIGTSGLLVHLARAVECRSVVIYGGREHAWQSGYSCNENLETHLPCAPCWLWNDCDYGRECMRRISAEAVVTAVGRALSRTGEPLVVDKAEL
ncbi:MAG: hypothetical protein N3B01_11295 [Verrucomicrobiae bacterium]|nr:hypothetical protein [Verrucomicrobiae bacterium]